MASRTAAWRPALRIARRDVLRAKGRGALVAAMVGLPVALVTCFASVYATNNVSDVESIPTRIGAAAAELQVLADGPVWQDPQMMQSEPVARDSDGSPVGVAPGDADSSETLQRLQQLTGGRIVDVPSAPTLIRTDRGRLQATAVTADVTSPLLHGLVSLRQGRLPNADDEVLVSRRLAERGFTVGSTIGLADGARTATVVGVGEVPYLGIPQTVVARAALQLGDGSDVSHRYLLERATPVTWGEVQRLNQSGVIAFSRAVVEHPPADWRATLPQGAQPWDMSTNSAEKAVLVLVIFSIVLEVVLLAGPAFAVGVRRQSRQLALVAATGGSRRDVRRIVLVQGVTLGAGASLLGAVVGLGVARLLVWGLPRYRGTYLGPWDVDWLSTGLALLLGGAAALVAAWAPARAACRTDVVAVLAGRRGQVRTRRGWPVLGGVLVVAGAVVAFTIGIRPGGEFGVAGGTLLMVLGAIALMPALIGLVGRLGAHLPLPLRLAARDSARQRGRTAPAVAAVMAAVAGVTALAIGGSSDAAQRRLEYQPRQPAGVTTIQAGDLDVRGWQAVDRAVREQTGREVAGTGEVAATGIPARPLNSLGHLEQLSVYAQLPGCPTAPPSLDGPVNERCSSWQRADSSQVDVWASRGPLVVAAPDVLEQLGYSAGEHEHEVLEDGGVLVPNPEVVVDGKATVTLYRMSDDGTPADPRTLTLPAAYLPPRQAVGVVEYADLVLTPSTAEAHGLGWVRRGGVLMADDGAAALSKDAEARLEETLSGITPNIEIYTERGFVDDMSMPLLGLALIGGLAVLIGTLTATGLALADSRPDLATLAAVGARPRTRRVMAASQALVIGLLGALTGVLVGLVPGIAVTWPLTATGWSGGGQTSHGPTVVIPWLLLLGVGVAVPMVAALFAGTVVRSRLPLTRRLGQ
jgi:putative ABC transport system permease protein